jgi:hypothetical protein
MWARVARFEGDPAKIDASIEEAKGFAASGDMPPELVGAKMLMLVDRKSGEQMMVAMFETEDKMRAADTAMNAGNPQNLGSRRSVEFYEIAGELSL